MIHLSNQHSFEYLAASGALAYDGRGWPWEWPLRWMGKIDPSLFTIVTKTLTAKPRKGNLRWHKPWACVRPFRQGVLNAVGLTNPGFDWWLQKVAPKISQRGYSIIVSLMEDDPHLLVEMIKKLEGLPIQGIELNASCPNTEHEISRNAERIIEAVHRAEENSSHPILLKLSVNQDYLSIAKVTQGRVQALAINSVPWKWAYPHDESPLASFGGGGLSGKVAQRWTWKMVRELSETVKTPVIGPSIWDYEDLDTLRKLGAKAISFGSLFLRYPWRPTQFVRRESETAS